MKGRVRMPGIGVHPDELAAGEGRHLHLPPPAGEGGQLGLLAVFSINNVHANAGRIVDSSMASEERLEDIRRSVMDIHRLALSHIVAADHATMIQLVQEIKAEEAALDEKLAS